MTKMTTKTSGAGRYFLFGLLAGAAIFLAIEEPEIRRYLKMMTM